MKRKLSLLLLCAFAQTLCLSGMPGQTFAQESEPVFPDLQATSWNEADQLFRRDPRWLGGDGAYSVDLGGGRVLWLFGDSFIADRQAVERDASQMVRNSVAIQTGYDPSKASLKFYWRTRNGKPADFVSDSGKVWLWPTAGVRLQDKLLLFFTRVRPDERKGTLGFKNFDWAVFLVDRPDDDVSEWVLRRLEAPQNRWNIMVGTAALETGNFLYAFGFKEPSHDAYLLRWTVSAASSGNLSSPEWWCGTSLRWVHQQEIQGLPAVAIPEASSEFSVHRDSKLATFIEVQSVGFGASDIAIRHAEQLEGPWSRPVKVYHPPESNRPDAFVYAAKAHPELTGAEIIVTYVANSFSDQTLAKDISIYYPRFVRLSRRDH